MESIATAFPKPGTKLTYSKALEKYDILEKAMLAKVHSEAFIPNVRMYDLMWEIDSIAHKYGIEEEEEFRCLHKAMLEFNSERTALANGVNGERFYLLQDSNALAQHDDTHLFEVKIDGAKLWSLFEASLAAIEKESGDEYADVYSPESPEMYRVGLASKHRCRSVEEKWLLRSIIGLFCLLGLMTAVHAVMQAIIISHMIG